MEQYGSIYALSDREITEHIGKKIRRIRLNENITAEDLQLRTGIHKKTIGDAENGKNVTLGTLISILRGLNASDLLEHLTEDEPVSPVSLAMNNEKVRERARRK